MPDLRRLISLWLTPLLCLIILLFVDLEPGKPAVTATFSVALLMAVWWMTEVIPLAVTSLLPVVLFPLLGIMDGREVSTYYFNDVIFLFLGGFIISLAMQRWDLHRRIALTVLSFIGARPGGLLLGFMAATSFLSMWVSNTATTMMMVPILISLINKLEESLDEEAIRRYSTGILLGVAYASSIGGIATLIGTPPNPIFISIYHIYFPEAPEISFGQWFIFAFPISLMLFIMAWGYLFIFYRPRRWSNKTFNRIIFKNDLKNLGRATFEEKVVFLHFILAVVLWFFRTDLPVGIFTIKGWTNFLPFGHLITDGTIAILISVSLFLIPARTSSKEKIMTWKSAEKLPWNILLLFGGGFALAAGFKESGLSEWIGNQLDWVSDFPTIVVIIMICLTITFLTELTSNTATTEMILPVLAGISISTGINPLLLMLPATLSASMAFMLPVATPPNAIVFGTNRLTIASMARAGLFMNLIGAAIISLFTYWLTPWVFGVK